MDKKEIIEKIINRLEVKLLTVNTYKETNSGTRFFPNDLVGIQLCDKESHGVAIDIGKIQEILIEILPE